MGNQIKCFLDGISFQVLHTWKLSLTLISVKLQRAVHHKGKEGYYAHILIPDSRPCLLEVLYYSADISMPSQYNKLDAKKDIVVMLMTLKAILKYKDYDILK